MTKVNLSKVVELAGNAERMKTETFSLSAVGYATQELHSQCSPETILALAEALKIAVGALDEIKTNDYAFKKGYTSEKWAESALTRIAELVEGFG